MKNLYPSKELAARVALSLQELTGPSCAQPQGGQRIVKRLCIALRFLPTVGAALQKDYVGRELPLSLRNSVPTECCECPGGRLGRSMSASFFPTNTIWYSLFIVITCHSPFTPLFHSCNPGYCAFPTTAVCWSNCVTHYACIFAATPLSSSPFDAVLLPSSHCLCVGPYPFASA